MRRRAAAGAIVLGAVLLAAVAALTPSTSSAYNARVTNTGDTAATNPYFRCADMLASTVDGANAVFVWPLNETSGTTAADSSGHGSTGTYQGTLTSSTTTPMACPRDSPTNAFLLDGTSNFVTSTGASTSNPVTYSVEVWFKTTYAQGKLIGFGSSQTGYSTQDDREIYFTTTGKLGYGIYDGAVSHAILSSSTYNDGKWHLAVATQTPTGTYKGMRLYVDGSLVNSDSTATVPENYSGWWRIGWDNNYNWAGGSNAAADYYFKGSMRYAAVYTIALTPTQIAQHYGAGSGS